MAFGTKSYEITDSVVCWVAIFVMNLTATLNTGFSPLTMGASLITALPALTSLY
jgi:hypothetical protein